MFPRNTGVGLQHFNLSIVDLPLAKLKLFDYDEYKYSQLQMVLTPINISNGAQKLEMNDNSTPYLYFAKRIHPEDDITNTDLQTWKNTPGVQRVSLLGSKPIVINFVIQAPKEDEIIANDAGQAFTIQRPMRRIGWIHNPQSAGPPVSANYPNFGVIDFRLPQIATGSFQPKWRVDYYVTTYFKGHRALQIDL
jgi:hypothetical protein